MLTRTINSTICGFRYYRKYWSLKIVENLLCSHGRHNAFNIYSINTCKEDRETIIHLPCEFSHALKLLLERGAKISAVLMSPHYRQSHLVQGCMEIPCKVTVEMSPTLKSTQLMDCLMVLVKALYSEVYSPIILGWFLADELEGEFISNKTRQGSPKATIMGRVSGTKWRNPVKLDRARKVRYLLLRVFWLLLPKSHL